MFKNSSKILFYLILMLGTMVTISSNSWLSAWMGLEINLLSFIPLMNDNNNLMSTEASLKYFLTQALASSILLFAIILSMLKFNIIYELNNKIMYANMIIFSALLLKSGAAPFHFWFPTVMEGLTWINSLTLMTWQKIAPLMLISYFNFKILFSITIILSVIIGSIGGLNQTSLRKIMTFSSINHLGWMLSSMMYNESLWLFYFLMYSFLSMTIIYFLNTFKLYHINQLFNVFFSSKTMKFSIFFNFLSLGGLPPFMGFLPKWMVIQTLTYNNQFILLFIMVMMTLITLYYYLRMSYAAFLLNYFENNWMLHMYTNNFNSLMYLSFSFISTFSLLTISLIYFIF
uniref:NADH-ubiquinone oxidoreductase chain 2 n=1 Tax=Calohilara tibetensis TaxID=2821049 RepID=A0A8A5RCC2_9MUSC|nr:NADH dehydrogenase subunit 2 [Calohilara tibetensis]QTG40236.1 NADH dehydrogenase subunit 2 [Calohilara tibetensis]